MQNRSDSALTLIVRWSNLIPNGVPSPWLLDYRWGAVSSEFSTALSINCARSCVVAFHYVVREVGRINMAANWMSGGIKDIENWRTPLVAWL